MSNEFFVEGNEPGVQGTSHNGEGFDGSLPGPGVLSVVPLEVVSVAACVWCVWLSRVSRGVLPGASQAAGLGREARQDDKGSIFPRRERE